VKAQPPEALRRLFAPERPDRLIRRGHPAGDFLEAYDWRLLEERPGFLRIEAHLPERVKNPRGELFGGFTGTYVDLVALFTVRAGRRGEGPQHWLATANMRLDYFAPVKGPRFEIESELVHRRRRTVYVRTAFREPGGPLLVHALTTLREVP